MLRRLTENLRNRRIKGYTLFGRRYKPMLRLLNELRNRNVHIQKLRALEVFGNDGLDHTTTYAHEVESLDVWEKSESYRVKLQKNLPMATVKITDSFKEVYRTREKYNFIVIDNPIGLYCGYCCHFELFPDPLFNITENEALLVLDMIPHITGATLKRFPYLVENEYLERRREFYNTDQPANIPLEHVIDVYKSFILKNGYELAWNFEILRNCTGVYYLVFKIEKKNFS